MEPVPRVNDVGGEVPAGWNLQNFAAGVNEVAGGGAYQRVTQGFRFSEGKVALEGEVCRSYPFRDAASAASCNLQPATGTPLTQVLAAEPRTRSSVSVPKFMFERRPCPWSLRG